MLDALGAQVLLRELEHDSSRYLDELAAELTTQLGKRITIAHVLVGLQGLYGVAFHLTSNVSFGLDTYCFIVCFRRHLPE
jgi:hypothetical protein